MPIKLPFFTLIFLISFASVNATLFTPALPNIAEFFNVTNNAVQHTITWFLVGYALGQLIYGPLANRFGRKPALYAGIGLQIVSSLLCVFSSVVPSFWLLVFARFMLALGSGVGLKMTFTLVNECCDQKTAGKTTSYLMLAFAVTPGLGVALGGYLNVHFGWVSCFYAGAIYGLLLMLLVTQLPETLKTVNKNALQLNYLVDGYGAQFKNFKLVVGGLLMGGATSFFYAFAALAPFIAITIYGLNSAEYGAANIIPCVGLFMGSLLCAQLTKHYELKSLLRPGLFITLSGIISMAVMMWLKLSVLFAIFLPMVLIYFGLSFIMAVTSTITMAKANDKAYGSAVMSFLNMGSATMVVLSVGAFTVHAMLLPAVFLGLCVAMFGLVWLI
ncbi:MAG TPA: MFS transporter [Gammaproteobacteria bacterium]|nr:MFS transporter [Gammaproteobacteria bacterium]